MTVAALVDAGVPPGVVTEAVGAMGVPGLRVRFETRRRGAFVGRGFVVAGPGIGEGEGEPARRRPAPLLTPTSNATATARTTISTSTFTATITLPATVTIMATSATRLAPADRAVVTPTSTGTTRIFGVSCAGPSSTLTPRRWPRRCSPASPRSKRRSTACRSTG